MSVKDILVSEGIHPAVAYLLGLVTAANDNDRFPLTIF